MPSEVLEVLRVGRLVPDGVSRTGHKMNSEQWKVLRRAYYVAIVCAVIFGGLAYYGSKSIGFASICFFGPIIYMSIMVGQAFWHRRKLRKMAELESQKADSRE